MLPCRRRHFYTALTSLHHRSTRYILGFRGTSICSEKCGKNEKKNCQRKSFYSQSMSPLSIKVFLRITTRFVLVLDLILVRIHVSYLLRRCCIFYRFIVTNANESRKTQRNSFDWINLFANSIVSEFVWSPKCKINIRYLQYPCQLCVRDSAINLHIKLPTLEPVRTNRLVRVMNRICNMTLDSG